MPIIKSAKRALRQTKKRTLANQKKRIALKSKMTAFRKHPDPKTLATIYSLVDKLAKTGIIHQNKANRLKSRLAS